MALKSLLLSLFRYKASVDVELLDALRRAQPISASERFAAALRVLDHAHTVDAIFVANLEGRPHAQTTSWHKLPPQLGALDAAMRAVDQWYIDYVENVDELELGEEVGFTFTDGGRGRMSREEMLAHVLTHAGYHRGEAGRLLPEIEATAERDVFTGYLHRAQPERRRHNPA